MNNFKKAELKYVIITINHILKFCLIAKVNKNLYAKRRDFLYA